MFRLTRAGRKYRIRYAADPPEAGPPAPPPAAPRHTASAGPPAHPGDHRALELAGPGRHAIRVETRPHLEPWRGHGNSTFHVGGRLAADVVRHEDGYHAGPALGWRGWLARHFTPQGEALPVGTYWDRAKAERNAELQARAMQRQATVRAWKAVRDLRDLERFADPDPDTATHVHVITPP